jgi:Uncharacterised nucleotidyltransferase
MKVNLLIKDISLNFNNIPIELKTLLEIVEMDKNTESFSFPEAFNWEQFVELAKHHRLYPQLFSKIRELNIPIPSAVNKSLLRLFQRNTFTMLHLTGEMNLVSQLFHHHQVKTIFLKGPILGKELYGDISMRTSGDLDVLVPLKSIETVDRLLSEVGYVKDEYFSSILDDWKWRHHHVTYFHSIKQIKLEIHWRLSPGPGVEPSFMDLWNRKRQSTISNIPIYMLGKEDLFMFLISHGARHGWSRLRWLADIHQLVLQGQNWKCLYSILKKYEMVHLMGQALLLSSNLFKTPLNQEMEGCFRKRESVRLANKTIFYFERLVNLHTEPLPPEVSSYHKSYLFSLKSLKQKVIFILSFLHPYPEDAETLPLPKSLHYLYFPLRPALWFWRKAKKQAVL